MQTKRLTLLGKVSLLAGMALVGWLITYGVMNTVNEYSTLQQMGIVGSLFVGSSIALFLTAQKEDIPFKEVENYYADAVYMESNISYSDELLNRLDSQDEFSHDMAEQVLLNKRNLEQMALYLKGQSQNQPQSQLTGREEGKYIEV